MFFCWSSMTCLRLLMQTFLIISMFDSTHCLRFVHWVFDYFKNRSLKGSVPWKCWGEFKIIKNTIITAEEQLLLQLKSLQAILGLGLSVVRNPRRVECLDLLKNNVRQRKNSRKCNPSTCKPSWTKRLYHPRWSEGCRGSINDSSSFQDNYAFYDGFVVLQGTDTMAYTASALSFMLENLGKPVVVTGSQVERALDTNH